jgi:hypothetical protein
LNIPLDKIFEKHHGWLRGGMIFDDIHVMF